MAQVRGDFGEGNQHELALEHARVGDLQFGRGDGLIAIYKDIDVEEAGAFGESFFAAEVVFDGAEGMEEREWREVCFGLNGAIEEPRLVEVVHGGGFVERGEFLRLNASGGQGGDGGLQVGGAVAEVGAEGEVDGGGHVGVKKCSAYVGEAVGQEKSSWSSGYGKAVRSGEGASEPDEPEAPCSVGSFAEG